MRLGAYSGRREGSSIHQHGWPDPVERHGAGLLSRVKPYLAASCLLVVGIIGLALASLSSVDAQGRYIVFAAPGATLADTVNLVRRADGRLVQAGRYPNIVIAGSDRPDFAVALRHAGAWLAIAAPARGGCLDPSPRKAVS